MEIFIEKCKGNLIYGGGKVSNSLSMHLFFYAFGEHSLERQVVHNLENFNINILKIYVSHESTSEYCAALSCLFFFFTYVIHPHISYIFVTTMFLSGTLVSKPVAIISV